MKKLFENWRRTLNEGMENACNPNAHSLGWINPKGEFVGMELQVADNHPEFAQSYFKKGDDGRASEEEKAAWRKFKKEVNPYSMEYDFLIGQLHWIRVANAYTYLGPKMESIPDDEWSRIVSGITSLVAKCPQHDYIPFAYEYPKGKELAAIQEKDPKRFITALRRRGKIAPSRVAQFRETQEKENLQELQVMGDRDTAEYVVAWRAHVWLFPDDNIEHMRRAGPFNKAPSTIHDLVNDLEDAGRQDVLIAGIDGNRLNLMNQGSYNFDPQSSILIKKLVKALGLSGVSRTSAVGLDYSDDEWTGASSVKGKIPDIVYHGTTTAYLPSIMKLGLKPGERKTNYEAVDHPEAVFFASRFDEAWAHAVHTTSKIGSRGFSEPVVIGMKIPDPAKLIPDYDIDQGAEGTNFDYIDAKTRELGRKYGPRMKGKSMSLSQEFGIYGYKGRIPTKFMMEYHICPNVDETGVEAYEIERNQIQTVTPRQMKIYLETKDEYGYGYFSYDDIEQLDDEDEEYLNESEEKYLLDGWKRANK